jgi:hypothetical protein
MNWLIFWKAENSNTVDSLLGHTPWFPAETMGYGGVWGERELPKIGLRFFIDI